MAAPRKSATKTAAREKARAAAAARLEREKKIMAASEAFFAATLGVEDEKAALREKIAALQAQVKELDGPRPDAAEHVRAMKDAGLPNKEIAELLELSAGEVGQYLKLVTTATTPAEDQNGEEGRTVES
ncbi:hypothetical protein [Corynebacterium dentalis]|uniref:hypothetical protein n=1 Tax=Corynebacterium dentalis TaxID=2014528 RepID=UPI0028A1B199|nr:MULTISPECIES: hypothetical protein [Actinomycetes]